MRSLFVCVTFVAFILALFVNWNSSDSLVRSGLLAFAFGVAVAIVVGSIRWFLAFTAEGQSDD